MDISKFLFWKSKNFHWSLPRTQSYPRSGTPKLLAQNCLLLILKLGLPWWFSGKESTCQCRRHRFDSWVGKIPWIRKWQSTPVSLPGKSHKHRTLMGCSPWSHKKVRYNLATKQQQLHKLNTNWYQTLLPQSWSYFSCRFGNFSITLNQVTWICACPVTQSCLTLCDSMDCSPPVSSIHRILQARME